MIVTKNLRWYYHLTMDEKWPNYQGMAARYWMSHQYRLVFYFWSCNIKNIIVIASLAIRHWRYAHHHCLLRLTAYIIWLLHGHCTLATPCVSLCCIVLCSHAMRHKNCSRSCSLIGIWHKNYACRCCCFLRSTVCIMQWLDSHLHPCNKTKNTMLDVIASRDTT